MAAKNFAYEQLLPQALRDKVDQHIAQSKSSLNSIMLQALDQYLALPADKQLPPEPPKGVNSTIFFRMPLETKQRALLCAASWQIQLQTRVSMNAVVTAALRQYINDP